MKCKVFFAFGEPGVANSLTRSGERTSFYVPADREEYERSRASEVPTAADEILEVEVNTWLRENPEVVIISQSLTVMPHTDGVYRTLYLSVLYEQPEE